MSDDFDLNDDDSEGIKSLRKAYETQKKQNDDLLKELTEFRAQKRQESVAGVLKAKGLPTSAAKLYHGEDVSEDAVGKWLDEFADVFGIQSAGQQDDANANNAQRVVSASGGAEETLQVTPGQQVLGNPNEIMHAIQTLPMDELERLGYMPKRGTIFNQRVS